MYKQEEKKNDTDEILLRSYSQRKSLQQKNENTLKLLTEFKATLVHPEPKQQRQPEQQHHYRRKRKVFTDGRNKQNIC
jgi:hypothetical protein